MKKMFFSVIACLALTGSFASSDSKNEQGLDLKKISEEKTFLAPCGGTIFVYDRVGNLIYAETYASNASNLQDCSDGFLKHLDTIVAQYPPANYSIKADVTYYGS